ncbi:MAG: hypothetical protein GQ475_08190 [Methylococcaceae bacterium]|nr:hypothetical protein [Methylococcaceae bacterium]
MNTKTELLDSAKTWVRNYFDQADVVEKQLEFITGSTDINRPNRLCVTLSDIHLTDGTVGLQNLRIEVWDAFYISIKSRCKKYGIEELVFVLDGDVIDMIRTSKWAENGIYPWERSRKAEFSKVVQDIVKDIVDTEHKAFFQWIRELPEKLKSDTNVKEVNIVVTLGNHDKELLIDQAALAYFYTEGLGQKLDKIPLDYRKMIGRMYGDEMRFTDPTSAPYLPFYYGDRGFRFFTTHGQWRDKENSLAIKANNDLPGWSAKDGWQPEIWATLAYSPFLAPCFGDTIAAGVLSTFIYKVKENFEKIGYHDPKLNRIIDELDLYRPTYGALIRILKETSEMKAQNKGKEAIEIIERTLYLCSIEWLSWEYTYKSSPLWRQILFYLIRYLLPVLKLVGIEIIAIKNLMEFVYNIKRWNPFNKTGETIKNMRGFPGFLPEYQHYGFQIHGEGHTHVPIQEEPNIAGKKSCSYINFGTWRDQVVMKKGKVDGENSYRRRGMLRALFILDIQNNKKDGTPRSYDYFTEDIIHWGDRADNTSLADRYQPHI